MNDKLFIFFQKIAPQHLLSRVLGYFASNKTIFFKNFIIKKFISSYNVNMQEALHTKVENYSCFNDFFTRELQVNSRPIASGKNFIVSPADGVISAIGAIDEGQLLQAKGKYFSVLNLLGGDPLRAQPFMTGNFTTIYLSPKDYHRVHMPFDGILKGMVFIPGKLFSVNQTTSENIPDLFARNERVVCIFDTTLGPMAVILVGAMIVASIETIWAGQIAPSNNNMFVTDYSTQKPAIQLAKGDELGRFKLGSTAIVLFGENVMNWSEANIESTSLRMGQHIGSSIEH